MLAGNMPRKAQKIIAEWATEHRDALMADWELAVAMEPLKHIQGATMIKIIKAESINNRTIHLFFSDGAEARLDFGWVLERHTALTEQLNDPKFFGSFFLELGALCWPNGLELSPASLYERAVQKGILIKSKEVA